MSLKITLFLSFLIKLLVTFPWKGTILLYLVAGNIFVWLMLCQQSMNQWKRIPMIYSPKRCSFLMMCRIHLQPNNYSQKICNWIFWCLAFIFVQNPIPFLNYTWTNNNKLILWFCVLALIVILLCIIQYYVSNSLVRLFNIRQYKISEMYSYLMK